MIGRLILAATVLLAQLSLGQMACNCHPAPAPPTVAAVAAPCPMTQKIGCKCCAPESPDSAGLTASQLPQAKCQIVAGADKPLASLASIPSVETPAILAIAHVIMPLATNLVTNEKATLVVPRIRPPNFGVHGLRAPPTRSV
jgi:hypothetical protein